MQGADLLEIMTMLDTAFPNFLRGRNPIDLANLWSFALQGYTKEQVRAAVLAYIATETSGFAPTIGQIQEKLQMGGKLNALGESEAWAMAYKAIGNSLYNSQSEFDKLPPIVQRCIGSADQLHSYAMMDEDQVQTVVASNFQRRFRALSEKENELQSLPPAVRDTLLSITSEIGHPGVLDGSRERKLVEEHRQKPTAALPEPPPQRPEISGEELQKNLALVRRMLGYTDESKKGAAASGT